MTGTFAQLRRRRRAPALDAGLLAAGFAAAVALRCSYAGVAGAASLSAGLVFATVLLGLTAAAGVQPRFDRRSGLVGVAGAVALVLPVLLRHLAAGQTFVTSPVGYPGWAAVTVVVATAEEAFLRGAFFHALQRWRGDAAAVVGAATAFAGLHVPLYGWRVVPLDLAVGVALGALRLVSGGWVAPAIAHGGADLAGWWLA